MAISIKNDIEKKDEIKRSAKELFFRFGFHKTSMEDIAQQCGLAKPTLYYYYINKEAIFDEIVIEEARVFMKRIDRKLPKDCTADIKISQFFHMIYEDLKIYAAEMADIPQIICNHSPHGKPIIEKINELILEKLHPLIQSGKAEGTLDYENETLTLTALIYMTNFLNMDWLCRLEEENRDRIIDNVIHIILNGLKRRD